MSEIENNQSNTNKSQLDQTQDTDNSLIRKQLEYLFTGLIVGIPLGIYLFFFTNEGLLGSLGAIIIISWLMGQLIESASIRRQFKSKYREPLANLNTNSSKNQHRFQNLS